VEGTVALMRESALSPAQVVEAVASPGGTTVAALKRLDETGFDASVDSAVEAAVRRAGELGA
jgi:pyrroline-5-carboxylate reductase